MKRGIYLPVVFVTSFFFIYVSSPGGVAASGMRQETEISLPFHQAETVQEKTLESILHQSEEEENFIAALLDRLPLKAKAASMAPAFFTKSLIAAWRKEERIVIDQTCGGHPIEGELCGLDYDPLICAQDNNDGKFVYRTEQQGSKEASVSMQWKGETTPHSIATYRLIKSGKRWKLDGVACANEGRFNMPAVKTSATPSR
jgi:hypothetical protein